MLNFPQDQTISIRPEIAVIIPAHCPTEREFGWLLEALRSVHGQAFRNFEVVVVFDDSPIVGRQDEAPPWLKILNSQPRRGPGFARNLGVRATTAPWIVCLDADDRFKSDALGQLYTHRHEVMFTYGDLEYIGDRTGTKHLNDFNVEELRKVVGPAGITALFHRKVWAAVGGWREDLDGFEDIDFWLKCAEIGVYGRHINSVIFEYRQHASSRTAQLEGRRQAIRDQIRANHMPFIEGGQRQMSDFQQPQKVTLKYEGPGRASFNTPGSPLTGKQYRVDGYGAFVDVDPRDVKWLLSFASGLISGFKRIDSAPVTNFSLTAAASQPGVVREAQPVPNILELNAKEAVAAIEKTDNISDLLVLKAMEQAQAPEKVRKTVIAAVEKQLNQLQNPQESADEDLIFNGDEEGQDG